MGRRTATGLCVGAVLFLGAVLPPWAVALITAAWGTALAAYPWRSR